MSAHYEQHRHPPHSRRRPTMSTDTPRPERVTLSAEEREALARSVAATINYHSFDAAAETADFDMADAILDTNLAATSAGLAVTVERILAAREQALREEDPTREQVARYLERQSKAAGVPQVAGMYAIEWAHAIRGGAR